MSWFLVVIFSQGFYMFDSPSFESEIACKISVQDKHQVSIWQEELKNELDFAPNVTEIQCVNGETRIKIMRSQGIYLV